MKLYVVRHAEAEEAAAGGEDEGRRLTERGTQRMREAAKGLRRLGVTFETLLTSPLARAAETAAIVAAAYDNNPPPQVLADLGTGVAPTQLASALASYTRRGDVMIVGHEPQLSELVAIALTGAATRLHIEFKKGSCIAIEVDGRLDRGESMLLWMLTQRQLRKLGK